MNGVNGGRASRGFTLAEVAIALVVFSVTGLGATRLLVLAGARAREVDHGERRLWVAERMADSLAAGQLAGSGELVLPDRSRLIWQGGGSGSVEVRLPGDSLPWLLLPVLPDPVDALEHAGTP